MVAIDLHGHHSYDVNIPQQCQHRLARWRPLWLLKAVLFVSAIVYDEGYGKRSKFAGCVACRTRRGWRGVGFGMGDKSCQESELLLGASEWGGTRSVSKTHGRQHGSSRYASGGGLLF